MEFLKEKLGDKYDEVIALLGDTKLIVDDGKMIPKSRFDEVNGKLKKAATDLETLSKTKMTDEERMQSVIDEAAASKKQYDKAMSKLKAKEIFVDGGLTEKDYSSIIDSVVSDNEEMTTSLAMGMVNLLKSKNTETEKRIREEILKSTPQPPAGNGNTHLAVTKEQFEKMGYQARVSLKTDNPELYKTLTSEN